MWAASGRIGNAIRMNPYPPIFSSTPARSTDPTVGASVCASGSHVWNGHMGTLTANPRKTAANASIWVVCENGAMAASRCRARMSNVWGDAAKYIAMKPSNMKTLPRNV